MKSLDPFVRRPSAERLWITMSKLDTATDDSTLVIDDPWWYMIHMELGQIDGKKVAEAMMQIDWRSVAKSPCLVTDEERHDYLRRFADAYESGEEEAQQEIDAFRRVAEAIAGAGE